MNYNYLLCILVVLLAISSTTQIKIKGIKRAGADSTDSNNVSSGIKKARTGEYTMSEHDTEEAALNRLRNYVASRVNNFLMTSAAYQSILVNELYVSLKDDFDKEIKRVINNNVTLYRFVYLYEPLFSAFTPMKLVENFNGENTFTKMFDMDLSTMIMTFQNMISEIKMRAAYKQTYQI